MLDHMVESLGLTVTHDQAPFEPEAGAYSHSHDAALTHEHGHEHGHSNDHAHDHQHGDDGHSHGGHSHEH